MYTRKVQYYETDKMGIVHHSNYIRWMEEARMELFSEIGYDYAEVEKQGVISPVVSVRCDYKKTVSFGETVTIDVFVKKITAVKFIIGYEIYKEDGTLCTEGETSHCFITKSGKFVKLREEYADFYKKMQNLQRVEKTS